MMKESWDLADDFWRQHMNRIEELIEQAYEMKPYMVADPCSFDIVQKIGYGGQPMFYRKFNKEKFAELIILECVNNVMDGTKEGDHYAQRIERHFDNGNGGSLHFGVDQ